jgi:hypothetical protein
MAAPLARAPFHFHLCVIIRLGETAVRILKALLAEGIKTVGELGETARETLLTFQDLAKGSAAHLLESSIGGVLPTGRELA